MSKKDFDGFNAETQKEHNKILKRHQERLQRKKDLRERFKEDEAFIKIMDKDPSLTHIPPVWHRFKN